MVTYRDLNTGQLMIVNHVTGEAEPFIVTDMRALPVRRIQVRCKTNPEWGTFGVFEDQGDWYVIHGRGGSRILSKDEAERFWEVV